MDEKNLVSLLEQFEIPVPETTEAFNLIGLDFGDGEVSAAYVRWNSTKKKYEIVGLAIHENGTLFKNSNAFYKSSAFQGLIRDINPTSISKEGERYYNFKKCVGTDEARMKYIFDDGSLSDYSYEELMAEGFNIVVNTYLESDAGRLLDRTKPTIILVGCPSSAGWEKNKLQYAELLKKKLQLPQDVTKPVYIAVHKESNAALARELDPKLGTNRIKRHQVIVILDNGSSTFDITVVGVNGIPEKGEDSYQFGGNLIDENLLKVMRKEISEEYPGAQMFSNHGHKLGLRKKKEAYYGLDGTDLADQIYKASVITVDGRNETYEFRIDEDILDKVLRHMPVQAFHFTETKGSMIQKQRISGRSWLDTCRKIYEAFYQEMKTFFVTEGKDAVHPVVPDRIILSGGVSVMPEAQELVKEVFGVEPVMSSHPNFAVSEGLAYVLATEVRKKQFLNELLTEVPKELPGIESLRKELIQKGVEDDWGAIKRALDKWSQPSAQMYSIADWYNIFFDKEFNRSYVDDFQRGARCWFEKYKISEKITILLKKKFDALFPEYTDVFCYELPDIDLRALNAMQIRIVVNTTLMFGGLTSMETEDEVMSAESYNRKRDLAWRTEACKKAKEMEQIIRKGGRQSYPCRHRCLFGLIERREDRRVETPGLESMYCSELTDVRMEELRRDILSLLEQPIKEYVELITPYFNMTARR